MGWAKDARIYSVKVSGLEGSGDSGTGISVSNCFDVIKGWHNAKPIDPETGYKRPTVVNMSWGYSFSSSSTPTVGNYRGNAWTYGDAGYSSSAELYANAGIVPAYFSGSRKIGSRLASVDTDVQEMIDAGIHICKSIVAWLKFGNNETPSENNEKGDFFVGKYYILFDKKYKEEINELVKKGFSKDEAEKKAPIFLEAKALHKITRSSTPSLL